MRSSNQIAGFFDHQYFLEQKSYVLEFLHGDCNQGKIACKAAITGRFWPDMPTTIHKSVETFFIF